jgi:hypothetical protein
MLGMTQGRATLSWSAAAEQKTSFITLGGCRISLARIGLDGFFGYHGFRLIHQLQGFLLRQLNQSLG